ncbi:hypothetical protein ACFQHV_21180 [Promicromonospora thailandica]|uniref:Uncharacterized protein n=1 Tax=Promicromonospora thailandica TaxID=765201 RepID=A0A9X2JUB8_9MICO|nr:hypothetical protein [Promicromonospora thailandica]MCP2263282.1 hypothetical protein [Promicromonospora thailandica]BFF18678.1 hypothetical protein GCM10025730_21990 [Promicromonospora thailandica]
MPTDPNESVTPVAPKYAAPYEPPAESGEAPPDPDKGKDLWSGVSQLAVPDEWAAGGPSFNDDPVEATGSGDAPEQTAPPETPPLRMSMASVRGGMSTMVGELQALVSSYQALRSLVFDTRDSVFGQRATTTVEVTARAGGVIKEFYAPTSAEQMFRTREVESQINEPAREFAASMNPVQEKTLGQIADAIQAAGQFVAGIDRAGQSYGSADRKARFPEPPAGSITRT